MSPPPPGAQSRDVVPEQSLQGFVALEVVPQVVTCLCPRRATVTGSML